MRRALLQIVIVLLGVAGLIGLVLYLHPALLEQLRGVDRYQVPLAEVRCAAPAGLSRAEFLEEVQYYGRLPNRLDPLDDGLAESLREAFGKHPWVEQVRDVRVSPRSVEVVLTFRRPVLAVKVGEGYRAVDGAGVLLPRNASLKGLARLEEDVAPPRGPEGTPWGDPRVTKAARAAAP